MLGGSVKERPAGILVLLSYLLRTHIEINTDQLSPYAHLQPPSLSEWNPDRQRSHFQPVTVGLQAQVPEPSHWRLREPGEEGHRAVEAGGPKGRR